MFRLYSNSIWPTAAFVVVALVGCQSPWMSKSDVAQQEKPRTAPAEIPTAVDPNNSTAVDEQTMARVMEEVKEIGQRNPVAQQMLLDKLQNTKPELWLLTVEQFRSSLAYHDQLTSDEPRNSRSHSVEESRRRWPSEELRLSAEVGALVDPRGVRTGEENDESVARATPANMPPPYDAEMEALAARSAYAPRPLANVADARPMKPADLETAESSTTAAKESSVVALASYTAETKVPPPKEPVNGSQRASAEAVAPMDWRQHVELAIDDLNSRANVSPQSTAEVHQQVSLRMLELLAGDTQHALEPIPKISTAEQDYWSSQLFALATYLDHHTQPDDKRRAAASVVHLDEAVSNLRELGVLSLRNLTFCKKVYDYGAYEPHEEARFAAGEQVTLYVEVENYHSDSTEKGYCTSLGTSYEILDDEGGRVEGGDFPDVEDCCRSRRRDFHIQYGLALPKAMLPGQYRLELAMKDRQSDKRGHASIAFEIK